MGRVRHRHRKVAEAGILPNEHFVEDGLTVFAHARWLGAEGIVSKKIGSTYRSDPCGVRIKVRNPASIDVQRERSEIWNRRASGSTRQITSRYGVDRYCRAGRAERQLR
jgi:hypothetical protein